MPLHKEIKKFCSEINRKIFHLINTFLKERLTVKVLIAVAVATAGLWIMLSVSVRQFFSLVVAGDKNTAGILAGLFSGFAYAVLIIIIRILAQNFNPLVMTFFQNLFIAICLILSASQLVGTRRNRGCAFNHSADSLFQRHEGHNCKQDRYIRL